MNSMLSGKTALVTGAASGIGAACALALARVDADLVLADIAGMDQALESVASTGASVKAQRCDIADENDVNRLFSAMDERGVDADIVVHCAGILQECPLDAMSASDFDRVTAVNLRGSFLVGRAALPRMRSRGSGSFIAVASELAYLGRAGFSAYCASKSGMIGLVRSWAREFAPDVRVNALAPGPVDTPMLGLDNMSAESIQAETRIPMGRVAQPQEIAAVALFLAGPESSFMTGQTVSPNGGAVMF